MRKSIPAKNPEVEEALQEILEDMLPYAELEAFAEYNDISRFSIEMSRNDDGELSIISVYINE